MKGYLKTYRINGVEGYDPKTFISSIKLKVLDLIKQQKSIKLNFIFTSTFVKENPVADQIDENCYFHYLVETIDESTDLSDIFNVMSSRLLELMKQFQNQGSGWQFDKVENFDIEIDPFEEEVTLKLKNFNRSM